jgi:MFS family permease
MTPVISNKKKYLIKVNLLQISMIDHVETTFYILFATAINRDLIQLDASSLSKWSLSLPIAALGRVLAAFLWNSLYAKLGIATLLKIALNGVAVCCLGLGFLGLSCVYLKIPSANVALLLLVSLKSSQKFFSSAQSQAVTFAIMNAQGSESSATKSSLIDGSSLIGISIACLIGYFLSVFDPNLHYWPVVYLATGILSLLFNFSQKKILAYNSLYNTSKLKRSEIHHLFFASCQQALTYSTYYLVWIFFAYHSLNISTNFMLSQLTISLIDLGLLLPLFLVTKKIGSILMLFSCSCLLLLTLIGISSQLIEAQFSQWLLLFFGVGISISLKGAIVKQCYPSSFELFNLSRAYGGLAASCSLAFALWAHQAGFSLFLALAPFITINLLALLTQSHQLWKNPSALIPAYIHLR